MNNTDKFLSLYNELDALLRDYYHEPNRSSSVITRLINDLNKSSSSDLIATAKKLNMIRVLRNNIIHELDLNRDQLIDIKPDTIEFLEEVVSFVAHPTIASEFCTPLNKIFFVREDDDRTVTNLISIMRNRGFTQVPVLNKDNVLVGVFSPNALFNFLYNNPHCSLESLNFQEVKSCLPLLNHFSETYAYVSKDSSYSEISEFFLASYKENKKTAMVFVTKTGRKDEPLMGVIVLKDIIPNTVK